MKVNDKFLLKTYIGPFFLTFLVVLFVFIMQFLWKYIDDLVGKGLDILTLGKLFFYSVFTFVPMALPLGVLLSSLITFGNLAERNELTAMKSAGISLYRIIQPILIFVIAITCVAFVFTNNVVPYMSLKFTTLLHDIQAQKPALNIEEGIFYREIDNYIIRIGEKDKDNKTIHDIIIYDHTRNTGYTTMTYAEKGTMEMTKDKQYLLFTLENGFVYDENRNYDPSLKASEMPLTRGTFKSQQMRFDLSSFQRQSIGEDFYRDNYEMLNVLQLNRYIDTMQQELSAMGACRGNNLLGRIIYINRDYQDSVAATYSTTQDSVKKLTLAEQINMYATAIQTLRDGTGITEFDLMEYESIANNKWRYEIEWHKKFSLSLACLLLFFVGCPLGAIIRKGGLGIPLTVSVFIFVVYWVVTTTGERMARIGTISPFLGVWFASMILLPLGIFLLYKASTEAGLNDLSVLKKWFNKLSNLNPLRPKKS